MIFHVYNTGHCRTGYRVQPSNLLLLQERLTLHVGSDGSVTGLQYDSAAWGGCPPGLPITAGQLEVHIFILFPLRTPLSPFTL
jgi:hypothetical protein